VKRLFVLFSFLLTTSLAHAERHQWVLDESYDGPNRASFQKLRYLIPNLMRQTTIDVAVRLGIDFQDGWQYPLTVGFVDGSPPGVESALAYVQLMSNSRGDFAQVLAINLDAYERMGFNFEKVFAHELVHAMVNDGIGGEGAMKLPTWFHEGLAVFGSNQGESVTKTYAHQNFGTGRSMINGLEGPHGALDYAEDYLAFKYLNERVGSNALHNFVREVVMTRKGDVPGALQYTCNLSWDEFQRRAKEYSDEQVKNFGPPRRGQDSQAY
jgi:hypothetical protein